MFLKLFSIYYAWNDLWSLVLLKSSSQHQLRNCENGLAKQSYELWFAEWNKCCGIAKCGLAKKKKVPVSTMINRYVVCFFMELEWLKWNLHLIKACTLFIATVNLLNFTFFKKYDSSLSVFNQWDSKSFVYSVINNF